MYAGSTASFLDLNCIGPHEARPSSTLWIWKILAGKGINIKRRKRRRWENSLQFVDLGCSDSTIHKSHLTLIRSDILSGCVPSNVPVDLGCNYQLVTTLSMGAFTIISLFSRKKSAEEKRKPREVHIDIGDIVTYLSRFFFHLLY